MDKVNKRGNRLTVAAIDIGTTFSGYAFSFRSDFETNPIKIYTNDWSEEGVTNPEMKAPSVVLLNPDQSFNSFGYRAQSSFKELMDDTPDTTHNYYYIKNFKMQLYDREISLDMMITDVNGKEVKALKVFTYAIKYLKDHLLVTFESKLCGVVSKKDLFFVITVPAIWSDAAKQFMREASESAGIDHSQMILAYEPEAAALYCSLLPEDQGIAKYFQEGRRIMVVDLGGGTVDITVIKVIKKSERVTYFEHVYKVSGGAWGGNTVNEKFEAFLCDVVGDDVMENFKKKYFALYLDIMNDFEVIKKSNASTKINIKLCGELIDLYKDIKSKDLKMELEEKFKQEVDVKLVRDKLQFSSTFFTTFFQDCAEKITGHINRTFSKNDCAYISTIVLVGGFSESPIICKSIKAAFPVVKDIVSPFGASMAVLKGSVIFGHDPTIVTGRVCPETIGVALHRPYDPKIHLQEKTFKLCGKMRVDDCFEKMFLVNDVVKLGETRSVQVHDLLGDPISQIRRTQPKSVEVYCTQEIDPMYVTDRGCKCKGRITVNPPNGMWPEIVEGFIEMETSGTEITVRYRDKSSSHITEGKIDFL